MRTSTFFMLVYILCVVLCVLGLIYTHNTLTDIGVLIIISVLLLPLVIILKQDEDEYGDD